MFCTNCGKKIDKDSKFCPFCGEQMVAHGATNTPAVVIDPQPYQNPAVEVVSEEVILGKKKHRGLGIVIAILLVVAVMTTVAIGAVGTLFASPEGQVAKAIKKSYNAYAGVFENAGLPDFAALAKSQQVSESFSLKLKELSSDQYGYFGDLEGLGMQLSGGINLPKQTMNMAGALSYGSMDAFTFAVAIKDTALTAYSPEIFGENLYSLSTSSLGADLERWGGNPDIGFRIFDILNAYMQQPKMDKTKLSALAKEISVSKVGKSTVEVNGADVDCTEYQIVVPEDSMLDYLDAVQDAVQAMEYDDKTIGFLEALGVPGSEISYMESDIKALNGDALFEELEETIRYVGDFELTVYLDGGYVMAAIWEGKINGMQSEIGAYFGGGKNYVDDLSLVVEIDDETVTLESSGNHVAKNGTFTDSSVLRYNGNNIVRSEISYSPKQSENNFSWEISGGDIKVSAEGQMIADKKSLNVQLEEVTLREGGTKLCTLELGYGISPYVDVKLSAEKTIVLSSLSDAATENLRQEIMENIETWSGDITDDFPELERMLWYLF